MRHATRGTGLIALTIAAASSAAVPFRMTTADLARRDVQLKRVDATDLAVSDAKTGQEQTLPLATLVELRRAATKASDDGWFALSTRDGQRLVCKPTAIQNDSVVCATRDLGERTIAIADVAAISVASLRDDATPTVQQDELRLANGDRLRGIVSGGDAKSLNCQTPDGQTVAVEWANVRLVRFAQTQAPAVAPATFIVMLNSGTRVRATTISLDGAQVTLAIAGGDARVPIGDIAAIEHVAGDAMTLAWIAPTSAAYDPYFPTAIAAMPFAVDAGAAEAYGATTAIRVRPKTTLRWAGDAAFRRLRARCAIPAGRNFADVTIRVLDGDRVAFERKHVRSGEVPIEVDVSLAGGGSVGLEVDYGDDFDVQDQAIWLDATLLKSPATDVTK